MIYIRDNATGRLVQVASLRTVEQVRAFLTRPPRPVDTSELDIFETSEPVLIDHRTRRVGFASDWPVSRRQDLKPAIYNLLTAEWLEVKP
ncbi:MAG: hypothetical protein DYH20_09315 [Gammaproteobacteria bacterium PRO9]|nr:hypothetical protein [Gammaproteobacteria bacterium PRO9]